MKPPSISWPMALVISVALIGVFVCALKEQPIPASAITFITAIYALFHEPPNGGDPPVVSTGTTIPPVPMEPT